MLVYQRVTKIIQHPDFHLHLQSFGGFSTVSTSLKFCETTLTYHQLPKTKPILFSQIFSWYSWYNVRRQMYFAIHLCLRWYKYIPHNLQVKESLRNKHESNISNFKPNSKNSQQTIIHNKQHPKSHPPKFPTPGVHRQLRAFIQLVIQRNRICHLGYTKKNDSLNPGKAQLLSSKVEVEYIKICNVGYIHIWSYMYIICIS